MKKFAALTLIVVLALSLCGCGAVSDVVRDELGDEFGDAFDAQMEQNKKDMEQLGKDFEELSEELGEELGEELQDMIDARFNTPAKPLGTDPIQSYDQEGCITRLSDIPKDEVKRTEQLNISEFDPMSALTETMVSNLDDPSTSGGEAIGNSFAFLSSFGLSAVKVTQLRVTEAEDGRLNIDYGEPIEMKYSGKKKSLYTVLVDKYYSSSPSIIFTGGSKADEMIRSWFDLDGEGRYSMSMTFGRVLIGDCGYRLILEDGKLYQVPHLHEDTEFRVYYSENGEATYLFDAADLLRNLRIEMPEDEAEKVLARLKESGYLD